MADSPSRSTFTLNLLVNWLWKALQGCLRAHYGYALAPVMSFFRGRNTGLCANFDPPVASIFCPVPGFSKNRLRGRDVLARGPHARGARAAGFDSGGGK